MANSIIDDEDMVFHTLFIGSKKPVNYVNARGSSRNCPQCDSRVADVGDRKLYCAACDKLWDRDELASKKSDGRRAIVEGGSGGSAIHK